MTDFLIDLGNTNCKVAFEKDGVLTEVKRGSFGEDVSSFILSSLRDNGTSMIIVSHDASFLLDAADRMIIMKDGAKIKEGTPSEMRASSDPYISFLLHS